MTDYPLDIIIPVWNSPVEVRAALASFAADSPMARLVMVNNGSERETEAILHEFAEALDSRALLLSTGRNIGTVAAINLGLARSTAAFALVTNPFVRIPAGWFESVQSIFEQSPATGTVCLRSSPGGEIEADHGSFAAMVLKRELLLRVPAFDVEMDGALWALRDYARKATVCGQRTISVGNRQLVVGNQQELGSREKREQRVNTARNLYIDRWGEPGSYLVVCGDSVPGGSVDSFRDSLLEAARQGDRLTVTAESKTARALAQSGFAALHENIAFIPLPRFFSDRVMRKVGDRIAGEDAGARIITEGAMLRPDLQKLSFDEYTAGIRRRTERFYRGGIHA